MARLLQEAQQQGLLDVYLVMVTNHEWLSVPQNRIGYCKYDRALDAEVESSENTCDHWRGLDGSKPEWEPQDETLKLGNQDLILQVCQQSIPYSFATLLAGLLISSLMNPPLSHTCSLSH